MVARHLLHSGVIGVLMGLTRTLSRWSYEHAISTHSQEIAEQSWTYLVTALCIEENPPKLYHLSRVLGDIDSVLVAGGGNVDHNVSVQIALLALGCGRHVSRGR
jgi:hypothetical protein